MGNTSRPSGSFQALMQLEKQHERQIAEQQRKHEEEDWKENLENMTPAGIAAARTKQFCAHAHHLLIC